MERFERIEPYIPALRPATVDRLPGPKIPDIDDSPFAPKREGVHGFVIIPRKGRGIVPKSSRPWASNKAGSHITDFEELNETYGLPRGYNSITSPTGQSIGKTDIPIISGPEETLQPEDDCQVLL